ncbi:uncharacterized protein LOC126882213 [Diabrotica virgifera virgifera]|uniref:Reverse transcriptase domain-containing protein n=1 Tax=Diabrotica virgifera virgifera TaxID=50390 RepID=A0ABM5JYG3_DIAVI|nr:uncharacterized protein LOC126882213 [Diabrotica virgifera virgifera]
MEIDIGGGKCQTTLFFADDQVVVANDEEDMDYMFRKLKKEYEKWGLNMNMSKTEYLKIGDDEEDPELEIRTTKRCNEYKYLGSIISKEGTTKRDIEKRTQQGKKAVNILSSLLWSKDIRQETKLTIYRTLVEPIMTYGAEVWQMTKKERKRIEVVEMDYLRRACGISKKDHIRNEDIRRRTHTVYSSVDKIETRQLVWYGHVKRMNEDRWPKKALNYIPHQRRRRGRPSVAWEENVRHIMKDRAIKEDEWMDRKRWRSKCEKRQRL